MANTVEYIYEVLDRFSGPLRKFSRAVDRNRDKLRRMSQQAAQAGRSIATGLTLPIIAMGTAAAYAFGRFEAAMSNVSTLIDTSVESISKMGDAVLAISERVPVAIGDLTAALYDVRSAGIAASDQFDVLENSAKLAVAGLGTTKQATDLVTSALNAFELQGDEAARVYDVIFKTVKGGKTDISKLSQGFGAVAGQVAAAGIKFDEFLASVGALTTARS